MAISLSSLNPGQKQAVEALEGPVLVLAGAGTGKTKVLTTRLARLIDKGNKPESLLAVTFTNKAAREMRERAKKLVGEKAKDVWLSTFHSLCARILRAEIGVLGYRKDFTIYDDSDQESVVRGVLKELGIPGAVAAPDRVMWRISGAKNRGLGAQELLRQAEDDVDTIAASAFTKYQNALKSRNAVDFDDLLSLTVKIFNENPKVLEKYRAKFAYLMVDEYQDTNAVQYDIVRSLAGTKRNLFVVGDDDQSIYGWRGADSGHILAFERDFPGAKVVRLEQNYRSTGNILEAANAVISKNIGRHRKTLFSEFGSGSPVKVVELDDERAEAMWVAGQIRLSRQAGRRLADHAILLRTNAETRPFEEQLRLAQLPYSVVGGQRFYDRREVRDVLAYLRLAANPHDDAALARIANVPPRGIGDTSMERLDAFAAAHRLPLFEAFRRAAEAGVPKAAVASAGKLVAFLEKSRADVLQDPGRGAAGLVEELDLFGELRRETDNELAAEARINSIEGVLNDVAAFGKGGGTLEGYLEKIALLDAEEPDNERDAVIILTVHAAKGLEFPTVFVCGLEDGTFPHRRSVADDRSLEEERRLFYVAMTRARDTLVLSRPSNRTRRGKTAPALPSRFLVDLPPTVLREAPGKRPITEEEAQDALAKILGVLESPGKNRPPSPTPRA